MAFKQDKLSASQCLSCSTSFNLFNRLTASNCDQCGFVFCSSCIKGGKCRQCASATASGGAAGNLVPVKAGNARRGSVNADTPVTAEQITGIPAASALPAARAPVGGVPRGSVVVGANPMAPVPAPPTTGSTTASPAASAGLPDSGRRASLTAGSGQRALIGGAPATTTGASSPAPAAPIPAGRSSVSASPSTGIGFLDKAFGNVQQMFTGSSVGHVHAPPPPGSELSPVPADGPPQVPAASTIYVNTLAGQDKLKKATDSANRSRSNSDAALEQDIATRGVVTMPTNTTAVAQSLMYAAPRRSSLAGPAGGVIGASPVAGASPSGVGIAGGGARRSSVTDAGAGTGVSPMAAGKRGSLIPRSPSPAAKPGSFASGAPPTPVTAAMLSAAPTADELKTIKRYRFLGGYSLTLNIEQVLHTKPQAPAAEAPAAAAPCSAAATEASNTAISSLTAGQTLSFRLHFNPKAGTNNAFSIGYILDGAPFPTSAVVKLAKSPSDGKVFCLANFNRRAVIKLFGKMDDTAEVKGRFVSVDHTTGTELSGSCVLVETVAESRSDGGSGDGDDDEEDDVDLATAAAVLGISITEGEDSSSGGSTEGAGATGISTGKHAKGGKEKLLQSEGLQDPSAWLQLFANVFGNRFDAEGVKAFSSGGPEAVAAAAAAKKAAADDSDSSDEE